MNPETTPLDLNLFEHWDDDEDLWYKNNLVSLVQGDKTPTQVAIEIDTYITQETAKQYAVHQEYLAKQKKTKATCKENNNEEGTPVGEPNPGGHIEMVMLWIARLCTAFPPGHVGQDRIIAFLEALRALPRHEVVMASISKSEGELEDEEHVYRSLEMWPFGKGWLVLAEEFRYVSQPPPTERDLRYRNSQSAMVRTTALDLIDCRIYSVMEMILPFHHRWYPDLESCKEEGFNWLAGHVIAGAQWIVQPEAGRYVYRECRKVERLVTEYPRVVWSMERWRRWKDQFAFVAQEERFGERAREVAELAHERMVALEGEEEGLGLE
ncbi:hypothetical protein BO78DRAFT_441682 [Aspergillus sclerotiicarbonarius CBS 121057]|uniref:Uncharacterized protein n=1 Tax=Aspergillus sclerotiicarbonarius (strain CBS 121057 / IBT 28362) TaxID=1448318 RepID=A0A319EVD0_ASPSB|nr:hypothetical protein BO78DRAFT_441682 [Aspergillus sclerotiicarbonarius CBS 121057]